MQKDGKMTDEFYVTQREITEVLEEIKEMLFEKNRKYGDSALNPIRIFSKADPIEQIKVRLDDKFSRKKNQQNDDDEDIDKDIMGYMVLLRVAQKRAKKQLKR